MTEKTFKCVQCGECIVPDDKSADFKESRTGCRLFHDYRYTKLPGRSAATARKDWISRFRKMLGR